MQVHHAVARGDLGFVKSMLDEGAKLESRDREKLTPLLVACRFNQPEVAQELLSRGANIGATAAGWTASHLAAFGGCEQLASILLESGANPNAVGFEKRTPLHCAAVNGHVGIAELLLKSGADAELLDQYQQSALHAAAQGGHLASVVLFVVHGLDIHQPDVLLRTPLHLAAGNGHSTVVDWLLDQGADGSRGAQNGLTPLHMAVHSGHKETVDLLLDKGSCEVDLRDDQGASPLFIATMQKDKEIAGRLLKAGADPSLSVQGISVQELAKMTNPTIGRLIAESKLAM